jgi:predicted porin
LSSSRLGVKAVEDLDNGMKAVAVIEYALDTQTSAGVGAARQQMLAVAGNFGTVATGYLQTTGYDWASKFDPTAGSAVSPLQHVASGFVIGSASLAARAPRAVAYISPNFSGLTVAANYTTDFAGALGNLTLPSGATTGLKTTAYLLSATYDMGPLSVGGVYAATANDSTGATTNKEFAIGGSYDLGMAKLFGTYQSDKASTAGASAQTAISFGAVAPVGPGAVAFSYAKNSMQAANTNGNGFTAAYLQGLSKTTTAYVAFNKMSSDAGGYTVGGGSASVPANALGTTSSSLFAVGLNKKF